MKKRSVMRQIAAMSLVSVLGWASLGAPVAAAAGKDGNSLARDPRLDMVSVLQATGPHRSLGEQAKVFEKLVGRWDVEYTDFLKYVIGWILDGRAVQDIFTIHPSEAGKDRYIATILRHFDPKSGTWHATFIDPANDSVMRLTGVVEGEDRIVLRSEPVNGNESRWSCNDIGADSFVWREEESHDGGQTWRLEAELRMTRGNAVHPAK